jgi:glycosyltransferase involved in cell wall biosynthesis
MKKVLFVTLEPISLRMAGPAIRAVELGRQLSDEFQVTIFSPCQSDFQLTGAGKDDLTLVCGLSKAKLYALAKSCDIIYVQANVLKAYPKLARLDKFLVVDLYDPILLSVLAQYADDPLSSSASYRLMHHVLEKHMIAADFCICASERQRDYWIGRFCALGRLSPEIYRFDPSFRKVLDVVPFGLPADPPARTGPGMKGQIPGIGPNDKVMLWGGGIWEWFDPLTVIEAVAKLSATHPDLRLFFMGWRSPNPQVPLMPIALKSKALAEKLGVLGKSVLFHESWVPYEQRVNYLLDADIAVSAHFDLPETRFAFRTRMLDYLWTGLPIVTTGGDQLAETIEARGAGIALPYQDAEAWVRAVSRVLDDPSLEQQLRQSSKLLSQDFVWRKAAEPLRAFCHNPHRLPRFTRLQKPSLVERARAVYSRGGPDLILKRSKNLIEDILRR